MGVKNDITIIRLILGHWAGKLSEPEKKELDNWLAQSEKHRVYFQKWCNDERQNELLSKIGCYDPGEGWQQVVRKRNMRRNRRWWLVAAASVAILFGGLAVYRYSKIPVSLPLASEETSIYPGKRMARLITPSGEAVLLDTLRQTDTQQMKLHNDQGRVVIQAACGDANGDQPVYHCLEVPRGGEFSFLLPDSTTVFLNAESRLRFPDRFVPGSERIVYLSGEAYFDVKRDPRSPFLVCLEHSAVKVTGTSFNVKAYPDDTNEATTLISGTVSMGIGTTEQWIVLKPGEQGYYDATRKTLSQQTVDVNYYTAWKDGVFAFYRQPLEEVMKTLGRWYLFDTHYQNEALKSILYTGKIYRHASIREVLHTFELMDELTFDIKGKEVIVRRK
ncbi:FecR family protein [Odoribacter splanchnicus]|uniref:FecR family protein n=1 Tax=Odoribacter splanchnicus TaxID=28118 RepID=UPI001897CF6A|nr:FecR family protein [Odoribacter splanchnicus]